MSHTLTRTALFLTASLALCVVAGGAAAKSKPAAEPAASSSTPADTSSAPPATSSTPGASTPAAPAAPAAPPADTTSPAASGAATGASADSNATAAAPTVGLSVKDNTGAAIGQITELKPGANGQQMATIKMGTDTFAVATASLAVQNGAATINLTQAQLQDMIHKNGKP